jgi:hypothetical protein
MKLKFEIRLGNIEYLHRVLQLVNNVYWDKSLDDKILFYFDEDSVVIYPSEKAGIDRIYAKIQISLKDN